MCGITGWVDFGRDLRSERAAIEAYRAEGTPLRAAGEGPPSRVDMRLARWAGPDSPAP